MVAITVLCTRIRYTRLLLHFVNNYLAMVALRRMGQSSVHRSHKVVDPVHSTRVTGLVSKHSVQFKISMAATLALRRWSLGAPA
jgi:hypothetical protein